MGSRDWRAYLSVERDATNDNQPTNARDRIGTGPWYNAGNVLVANSLSDLHARAGDANLFLDERGTARQRSMVGFADAERTRHPDGIERGRHRRHG